MCGLRCSGAVRHNISDVVLHLHYTAREGGAALKKAAASALKDVFAPVEGDSPLVRLFSLRHEFPYRRIHANNLISPTPNRAINCTKVTVREPWDTILPIRKPVPQWISKQPLQRCVMH
jgi:hypothetical protein